MKLIGLRRKGAESPNLIQNPVEHGGRARKTHRKSNEGEKKDCPKGR